MSLFWVRLSRRLVFCLPNLGEWAWIALQKKISFWFWNETISCTLNLPWVKMVNSFWWKCHFWPFSISWQTPCSPSNKIFCWKLCEQVYKQRSWKRLHSGHAVMRSESQKLCGPAEIINHKSCEGQEENTTQCNTNCFLSCKCLEVFNGHIYILLNHNHSVSASAYTERTERIKLFLLKIRFIKCKQMSFPVCLKPAVLNFNFAESI